MARAPVGEGGADVALALDRVEALERDHDGLAGGEALGGGGVEQRAGLLVDLALGHAALEHPAQLGQREQ